MRAKRHLRQSGLKVNRIRHPSEGFPSGPGEGLHGVRSGANPIFIVKGQDAPVEK